MKRRSSELLWAFIPVIFACFICAYGYYLQTKPKGCTPPPGFNKSDLIGTWRSGNSDTFTIREDGKYRQKIRIDKPFTDYESDWLPWYIELSNNGIPYLHLTGMRLCAYYSGISCSQVGGEESLWLDPCENKWVKMQNEGILIIRGSSWPRTQLRLVTLIKSSDSSGGFYEYVGK